MNFRPAIARRSALAVLAVLAVLVAGCGSQPSAPPAPTGQPPSEPSGPLGPPAEPGTAPPPPATPPGEVIDLPGGSPEGAAFDPATGIVAVALRAPDRLALLDTASGQVRTVPAPGAARHLVLAGPGQLLVLGEDTDLLARVSLPSGNVIEQVEVGRQPHDAAQVGDTVFVANEFGHSVGVVRQGRMVRELPGLVQPGGLTAAGDRVAAVDVQGNRLHVFDARTLREVADLPAGQGPSHVRPISGGRVAVVDTRGNAVLTYQVTGEPKQLARLPVPGRAYGLDTDPGRGVVYAALANTNKLARVPVRPDGTLGTARIVDTVRQPNDVVTDPRTGTVYVVGQTGAQVQKIPAPVFEEAASDG